MSFSEVGWSWDQPVYFFEATWAGFDDPNQALPQTDIGSLINATALLPSRFALTVEDPLLCVEATTSPTMLLPVDSEPAMGVDVENEDTLGLELQDGATMSVEIEPEPSMLLEIEDEACN